MYVANYSVGMQFALASDDHDDKGEYLARILFSVA